MLKYLLDQKLFALRLTVLAFVFVFLTAIRANAQALTGTKSIPGNYSSIAAAVADLNTNGVGTGGVVFNIQAGYTETLTGPLLVTATGTAANPITFQKSGSGANPMITSFAGSQLASSTTAIDIMWAFVGSDYVTINQIDLVEAAANTTPTTQMEVGYGFYRANATDGANNNTVQNCTITLNRNNNTSSTGPRTNATGSVGIELMACTPSAVGTIISATSVAGANSNNKFYGNTIQNVNFGIALGGFAAASPYTLADLNNDIGGSSSVTGNNIINFGGGVGATSQCGAVFIHNQWSFNISYNTINNNNGSGINHPVSNRGIWLFASSVGASCNINNNKVTINGGASTTAIDWCLDFEMAQSGANGNVININNNQFLNCNKTVASTAAFTAIWLNTAASVVNVNNNYFYGFNYAGTGTTQVILSQLAGIGTLNINNNTIDSTVLWGTTATGIHYNIGVTAAPTNVVNINGNLVTRTILNTTGTGTKTLYPIYFSGATPSINMTDNTVDGLTRNGTTGGTTIGIFHTGGTNGTSTTTVKRNIVRNFSIDGAGTTSTMYGIQVSTGTVICDSNTVNNLSCLKTTGSSALYGIYDISSPNNENFNYNNIYNLTHNGTGIVYGLYTFTTTGTRNVSYNTIYNLTGSSTVTGILQSSSVPSIFNNKIYDLTTNSTTTAIVSGITITSTTAGTARVYNNVIGRLFAPVSNGGTTATVIGINSTTTTANTTIGVYNNTINLDAVSTGTNFSSAGVLHTYSATATSAALDLRNNIIVNNSTPNGTGITTALRRTASTNLNNFNAISNRNLFYAGTPAANRVIYYDGTNLDQTLASYKARVLPIDSASVTENVNFTNTATGGLNTFLGINTSIATEVEAGARNIAGITVDFNNTIRAGNIGYTGNSGAPDLGAIEDNYIGLVSNQMYFDSANADQITGIVPSGSNNNRILRIRVYSQKGVDALTATSFKLNTSGTTSASDITNAKVFYTGTDSIFNTTTLFGTTASPSGTYYVNGNRKLALGVNYFWVTYDISNTAAANNIIDARVDSIVLSSVNYPFINGDPAGSRTIQAPLNGVYNVGNTQTYPTLTSAIADLNALGANGPVTFVLKDALYNTTSGEVFPIVFGNYPNASNVRSVTIRPDVGVSSRIESNNATATFDINGGSYLTIDGRQGGVGGFIPNNNLIIVNTGTTGPAIRFINDADSNRIIYTDIRSNNAIAAGTAGAGVVSFATTTGAVGNDYNTIKFCDIHEETGGNPSVAISSIGSATTIAANNDFNVIDSCTIRDFFNATAATAAIYVGANNNNWTINGNNFYQSVSRTYTGTQTNRVLWITPNTANLTSGSGFVITNNYIGGNAANGSGVYTLTGATAHLFTAVDLSVGLGTPTSMQNNTITNFNFTSPSTSSIAFCAVNMVNGNVNFGTTLGNTIGSRTVNGAITYTATSTTSGGAMGIRTGGGTNNTFNIANNFISGFDLYGNATTTTPEFFGINAFSGTFININNNLIGDTILANSINIVTTGSTSTYAQRVTGIFANAGSANSIYTITNNTIANITNNSNSVGTQAATTKGILINSSVANTTTVTGNVIKNITTAIQTTATGINAALVGIGVAQGFAGNNNISNNTIHSLKLMGASSTTATLATGIFYSTLASGENLLNRNFIHSISLDAQNPNAIITGIEVAAGNGLLANNIIRLGLDSSGTSIGAPCLMRGIAKNTGSNNIYFNTVYVGGLSVGASNNRTFAFQRLGAGTDDVRNNIFVNARTNSTSSMGHFAVGLLNNTNLTMNFNLLKADSIGTYNNIGTLNLLGWKNASAVDANSVSSSISFINETGNFNNLNFHINGATPTPIEAYGTAVTGTGTDVDFDGQTRSTLTPIDLGADAGNFIPLDIAAPSIVVAAPLTNSTSTSNRTVSATISDATGIYLTGTLRPRIYFKKLAIGSYSSAQGVLVSGNTTNSTWNFTINAAAMGGLVGGDSVYYYIVAQDSTTNNNVGSFPGGVEAIDVNTITNNPSTQLSYKITPVISGNFNVGAGQPFTSLTGTTGIFSYINTAVVGGDITITLTSDIEETGTIALNETIEQGVGNYKISIVPDAATMRSLTGSVTTSNSAVIRLDGADRVKIDGSFNGTGRFIRIMNRVQGAATLNLLNDADNDTIANVIIEGVNNTVGMLNFFSSTKVGGTGNDSNVVIGCMFRDTLGTTTGNIPNTGIFSQGAMSNDYNQIINNEIYNFGFNGINLSTTSGDFWTISNNKFYQLITKNNTMVIVQVNGGTGHTINGNSFGGAAPDRSGTAFVSTGSLSGIVLASSINTTSPFTINNNTFSNMGSLGTTTFLKCIAVAAGNVTISNNVCGGGVMPYDTLRNAGDGNLIEATGGTVLISNNTLSDYRYYAGSTVYRHIGIYLTSGTHTVVNNTIRRIEGNNATTALGLYVVNGIYLNGGTNHVIRGNTISDIRNFNTGTGAYPVAGIMVVSSTTATIERNRISRISALGAGTGTSAPVVIGIYTSSAGHNYLNNQIALGENTTGETVVSGIRNVTTTGISNYYYNSIFINGSTTAGANNSFGMERTAAGTVNAFNNIIYNKRTSGGAGINYTVSSTNAITAANLGYNLLVANDTAILAQLGGIPYGWAGLNTLYPLYNTNWTAKVTDIPAEQLFIDTAVANLGIIPTNPTAWYVHGKALPLAGITGDFNTASGLRSASPSSGASDIGSVEFTTSVTPPAAYADKLPVLGDSTTFYFAGRAIAKLVWGNAGTVPSAVTATYYTGTNPANTPVSSTFMNSYLNLVPTGGSGYTANLSMMYDSATMGSVTNKANLMLAQYNGTGTSWTGYLTSVVSNSGFVSNNVNSTLGIFTGTDKTNNPLPVQLISFNGKVINDDAALSWITASEVNSKAFELERSMDGEQFEYVSTIAAKGNSQVKTSYTFIDKGALSLANTIYYRLKMIDVDGRFTYSTVVTLNTNDVADNRVAVYPNPTKESLTVTMNATEIGTNTIEFIDLKGINVLTKTVQVTKGKNQFLINESNELKPGVYVVRIISAGAVHTVKLIKE